MIVRSELAQIHGILENPKGIIARPRRWIKTDDASTSKRLRKTIQRTTALSF